MPLISRSIETILVFCFLGFMIQPLFDGAPNKTNKSENTFMKMIKSKNKGVVNGELAVCPSSPNCVVSEAHATKKQSIKAITYSGDAAAAWKIAQASLLEMGGVTQAVDDEYLHATFTTRIMRYVDDVELRLDADNQQIHMRSISRVGYSDMGANRRRMEKLRSTFEAMSK